MNFFYISNYHLLGSLLLFLLLVFLLPFLALVFLFLNIFILYLLRSIKYKNVDYNDLGTNIFFSPVSGRVSKIIETEKSFTIFLRQSFLDGWGIYTPLRARLEFKENLDGLINCKFLSKSPAYELTCKGSTLGKLNMPFKIGDVINTKSCIGINHFGGEYQITLPQNYSVLVKMNQKVKATKTYLAKLKES